MPDQNVSTDQPAWIFQSKRAICSTSCSGPARWAFYNIGAWMGPYDTGRMHGPERKS